MLPNPPPSPAKSKRYFWHRRGWLRYPLLGLLLVASAVALRGGFWSQTPAKAAKRAKMRSAKAKQAKLPKVQMLLEHNERDINLRIDKGQHKLPSPKISRSDNTVTVELAGVQVRPRKWTLSGSRVSSINVKVNKFGSKLVIAQDPSIKGKLKDAFFAEDVDGDLVLRVLNESIGDRNTVLASAPARPQPGIAAASAAPVKAQAPVKKARHPLGKRLNKKDSKPKLHPVVHQKAASKERGTNAVPSPKQHAALSPGLEKGEIKDSSANGAALAHVAPVKSKAPKVQVVEHPVPVEQELDTKPAQASEAQDTSSSPLLKTALSLGGSVLAFGLLALVPILWFKKKQQSSNGNLQVVERMALSPKHSLVRVNLSGQELWLGLSDGNIQVITPARVSAPGLVAANQGEMAVDPEDAEFFEHLHTPAPVASTPPATMARRKLQAFKMRLRDALSNPDPESETMPAQDAGKQADAIRRELERRQAQAHEAEQSGIHQDVA